MTQIISPWVVYLISIATGAKTVCGVLGALGGIGLGAAMFCWFMSYGSEYKDDINACKAARHAMRILILPVLVLAVAAIAIPDKRTCIAMIIAQEMTYERVDRLVEAGGDVRQAVKQDIIEIIQAVTEKESQ